MATVHHAMGLWHRGGDGLRAAGWQTALAYGAVLAGAAVLAWAGRSHDEDAVQEQMKPHGADKSRSERSRLEADFAVARRAQQNLLPDRPPAVDGYSVAAVCRPAREVGGDLYEFPRLADGRQAYGVADVSGKGVPAALYMTLTKGLLTAATRHSKDLGEIASLLNRHLLATGKHRTFVTMSLVAERETPGEFEHIRAGHNPPLLWRREAGPRFLQPRGLGLGLARKVTFEQTLETEQFQLGHGDILVLYSDGLVEAMNRNREQFGEERLSEVVSGCDGMEASEVQERILEAVDRFTAGAESHDDLTVLVLVAKAAERPMEDTPVLR
jgi:sigma-B regulation protein RsbU (phosphoserine phosphatase)